MNNFLQWRTLVSLIKNGAGIVSLKIFNNYVDPVETIPHMDILDMDYYLL